MKLIAVIIIGVFTIAAAIRVPASWPEQKNLQQKHRKFRTTSLQSEIGFRSRPHVGQKYNKINSGRKFQDSRHRNLKKPQAKKEFKASAPLGDWKPIIPEYMLQKNAQFFREPLPKKTVKKSPLYRNYRDDKTHEPVIETIRERHIHREKPSSGQELPQDIPTRPIYPGEGQWAVKGIKHRPYIPKPHEDEEEEEDDSEEETPDGYETFQKNQALFEKHRGRFRQKLNQFPQKHKFATLSKHEDDDAEEEEDDDSHEFVPMRVYTQVRRTENKEHLPQLPEDPRLREVIKDSKIQTVYSEEGYEDLAYDHAGHEKTAEEDEGYAEFDKEIEKERQRKQKGADSESAGSHHQARKKPSKSKDKLLKTKEVKTSLKGAEMEVLSEIKVLATPQNGTETHKFVKITPKFYEETPATEKIVSTSPSPGTTTQPPEYRSRFRRRFKRYTNEFPKITVDTDFIDKINHNLPRVVKIQEKPKYPYYNDPAIHPNSPLRYAEDLDNIPKKSENNLAFYNQADGKISCQEVETDVDPVPSRVKNADEDPESVEDATDVQELVKGPRLKNLGDKIDCFKVKYFGENPLDSPFFQEEIGPVLPIFKIRRQKISSKYRLKPNEAGEKRSYSSKVSVQQPEPKTEDFNILNDVIKQFSEPEATTISSTLKLQIAETNTASTSTSTEGQTETSVISIITTPKYTIDLKPKHIYHQIELLEYLPTFNISKPENVTTEAPVIEPVDKVLQITTEAPVIERVGKVLQTTTEVMLTTPPHPETQPLVHRRPRPRPRTRRPPYQIFDVNKYLPKHSFNLLNRIIRTSTVLPKRGATSEVYYKDEINASEQLNVFADVINNIKNSSKDRQQAASSNRVASTVNILKNYRKIPVVETDLDDIEETNSFYLSTTTLPPRGTIKYSTFYNKDDVLKRSREKYENLELLKVKKHITTTIEPYASDTRMSSSSNEEIEEEPEEDNEEEDSTDGVLGLMPPVPPNHYTTIVKPLTETKANIFYVLGMKPPPPKQKTYLYSDFKHAPLRKNKITYLRRGKRSPQRKAYAEVVRNRNKPIDVQDDTEVVVEDDDDYVPHRPKNYHYDEKTGRIVYDNTKKQTEAPEEEYVEVTEAPLPKLTRRNSVSAPRFKNFTGPSYVEFVKKLKTDTSYQEITDPPTTEKGEEEVTTTGTTAKPVSTEPPEFIGFLSKLRSDGGYKAIPDKTTSKTTTTEAAAVEQAEEQETQVENVKNSPGGQSVSQMYQIFDINEYLPKVKTYTPRTSIDYSKYKTIERAPVSTRHNLSSRYNSEEEDLANVKTSKVPIIMEEKKEQEINPVMSESKHEDVEPTTTTTTTTSAPTTRRLRTRQRGTRRTTTLAPGTTPSSASETSTVYNKPKRVFPRRRPTRIKVNRSTTEAPDSEIDESPSASASAKIIRRRHQKSDNSSKAEDRVDEKEKVVSDLQAKANKTQKVSKKDGDVQVFRKIDQGKKHGGNYKPDSSETDEDDDGDGTRLTDIVSKPSTYYTDPKLPKKINQLVEGQAEGVVEEGGSEEKGENEEVAEFDYEGVEEKTTTTKKPIFVKDPDKRMYYYAPI